MGLLSGKKSKSAKSTMGRQGSLAPKGFGKGDIESRGPLITKPTPVIAPPPASYGAIMAKAAPVAQQAKMAVHR